MAMLARYAVATSTGEQGNDVVQGDDCRTEIVWPKPRKSGVSLSRVVLVVSSVRRASYAVAWLPGEAGWRPPWVLMERRRVEIE